MARPVRSRRFGVRELATIVLAVITVIGLAACGPDPSGREGRGERTPRGESTPKESTPKGTAGADPSSTATTTPPPTTAPGATVAPTALNPKSVKITITAGDVKGAPDRLEVVIGQTVKITIKSDVADELHVHGVEQTLALPAGEQVQLEFVVPPEPGPGVYAVELHTSARLLFGLEVR